jgi:hypothetical protein
MRKEVLGMAALNNDFQPCIVAILALAVLQACTSTPAKPGGASRVQPGPAAARNNVSDIDLNCVMSHIQSPPEAFHYTFKVESDNPWQEDADITPQSVTGTFMNNSLTKPQSFQGPPPQVVSNLMGIGRMASIFSTIHRTAAVVNQGGEQKNGYSAVRFSIDTSLADPTEQGLFKSILGPGGFEKGMVWATAGGCPVQIVMDEELHARDGSVLGKSHYEEAMVKQ